MGEIGHAERNGGTDEETMHTRTVEMVLAVPPSGSTAVDATVQGVRVVEKSFGWFEVGGDAAVGVPSSLRRNDKRSVGGASLKSSKDVKVAETWRLSAAPPWPSPTALMSLSLSWEA